MKSRNRDARLEDLADAVADRSAVDWHDEQTTTVGEDERRIVEAMALIAKQGFAPSASSDRPFATLPDGSPVPRRWGTLQLLDEIGHGAFGTVFRARDTALDQEVALKVLHPDRGRAVARMLEEGRRLARLRHPNIVNVICVDECEELTGLRMELVHGESLAAMLRRQGPLDAAAATDIALQLCRALTTAHSAGIIHRDVKAHNVMCADDGRIVLMDLGAGLDFDTDDPEHAVAVVGTPIYLAPEILEGIPASPQSDLYSLGVLLYHLTTGEYPIAVTDLDDLRAAHRSRAANRLADAGTDLPQPFVEVVDRALSGVPGERFATAADMAQALAGQFRSADPSTGNVHLPVPMTNFVGRARQLSDAAQLIRENRLLTFTGAGGCGKTRIVLELGRRISDAFPDGVWFVGLASVDRSSLVVQAAMDALEVKAQPTGSAIDHLTDALKDQKLLLILDNCEHVTDGARDLATALLQRTSGVHVLATSRSPLSVPSEVVYPISPLPLPEAGDEASMDRLLDVESVELFRERARAADVRFRVDESNAPVVADICRTLDGIPLAIELATAQLSVLSLNEIRRRLRDTVLALGKSHPGGLPHQQTLRALIDWSAQLLTRAERTVFRRSSVFAGGWTMEAAASVCGGGEIDASEIPSLLSHLVSKSLIVLDTQFESTTDELRYRMLETIRERAAELLDSENETAPTAERHRNHFVSRSHEAGKNLSGPEQVMWRARIRTDAANLQRALGTCLDDSPDVSDAVDLVLVLSRFWGERGHWDEADETLRRLFNHPHLKARSEARARLLNEAGNLSYQRGEFEQGRTRMIESVSIARELDNPDILRGALIMMANTLYGLGEYDSSVAHLEEAATLERARGRSANLGTILSNLGAVRQALGETDGARAALEEAADIHRDVGNKSGMAGARVNLAMLTADGGDRQRACEYLEEALASYRELEMAPSVALCLVNLADHVRALGDAQSAVAHYKEAFPTLKAFGALSVMATAFEGCVYVAAALGDPHRAARLLGAVEAFREETNIPLAPQSERSVEESATMLRDTLGDQVFEKAKTMGRSLSMDEAIELVTSLEG